MKKFAFLFSAVALMALTLTSCNKNTPQAAAEKWLNSFYHMDYTAAKEVSTEETKKQIDQKVQIETMMGGGNAASATEEAKKIKIDIKETKNTSDTTATVSYTTSKETTSPKTLKMVKRGDKRLAEWSKMEDAGMPSGGGAGMPTTPDPMSTGDTAVAPAADGTTAPEVAPADTLATPSK